MIQFKPQKGKSYDKLPSSALAFFDTNLYIMSKKYDGHQVFVVKVGRKVRFFTSGWEEFCIEAMIPVLCECPGIL
jgi:hypothetical protein